MRKIYNNRTWAKDRGEIKVSQLSRTKPRPEKGHRWYRLREIPRMGRGPSWHRLELSYIRNPSHSQSHFPSGKSGVLSFLECFQVPSSNVPGQQGKWEKIFQEKLQKGSKEVAQKGCSNQPSWCYWAQICVPDIQEGQTNRNTEVWSREKFILGLGKEDGWLTLPKPWTPWSISAKHV